MSAKRKLDVAMPHEGEAGSAGYETDFHAWANEQGALLRAGKFSAADIENIAEEIESLGRSEKRELASRLAGLLLHLLKWQFQPGLQSRSWQLSIIEQREAVVSHLADNPSLKSRLQDCIRSAYGRAHLGVQRETGLSDKMFPASCPYTFQQMMDDAFWPQ